MEVLEAEGVEVSDGLNLVGFEGAHEAPAVVVLYRCSVGAGRVEELVAVNAAEGRHGVRLSWGQRQIALAPRNPFSTNALPG